MLAIVQSVEPPYSAPYTLRQLECFVAVADAGTISAAAAELRASDSAVADSVTALERTLGVTLLHRQRARGVSLTSDGLALLPVARRLLLQAEEVAAVVGNGSLALTGVVRVGAIGTLAPVVLARLISAAGRIHPGLRLEFRVGTESELVEAIEAGNLDLIVGYDIDVPPELKRTALFSTYACVIVSTDHPLARRRSVRLAEIADEPMVMLDIASSRVHTLELMSSAGITPRIAYRTDNYELCRSLVGQGLGYSLLMWRDTPRTTWDGGEVAFLSIQPPPREVRVLALWRGDRIAPRTSAMLEALRTATSALPAGPSI